MNKRAHQDDAGKSERPLKKQKSSKVSIEKTITITFGNQAENHVGMQKVGREVDHGFTSTDLKELQAAYEKQGKTCEFIDLTTYLPADKQDKGEEASLLIIRKAVDQTKDLWKELSELEWDKKAKMYGQVRNKNARWNLVFGGDKAQEPDYEKGKGRIIPWSDVPLLSQVHQHLQKTNQKEFVAEGNYYYDLNRTFIGGHGDGERNLVVGLRLGSTMPLAFRWFNRRQSHGTECRLSLNDGDLYFMSDKACGHDWRSSSLWTLRHAAGIDKFLQKFH